MTSLPGAFASSPQPIREEGLLAKFGTELPREQREATIRDIRRFIGILDQ